MGIAIVDYEAPEKVPAFVDDVEEVHQSGKHGAVLVSPDEKTKTKRQIHEAARYLGLSARFVDETEKEDGQTQLIFRVTVRKPRKAKADAEAVAAE